LVKPIKNYIESKSISKILNILSPPCFAPKPRETVYHLGVVTKLLLHFVAMPCSSWKKAFSVAPLGLRVWVDVLPRAALWPGGRACPGLWSFHRFAALLPMLFFAWNEGVWHKSAKGAKEHSPG
jgi:hypothetical protein